MLKALVRIDGIEKDACHQIGEELIRPLSITFGRSFYLMEPTLIALPTHTAQKVVVVALALLLLPLTLLSAAIGALLLSRSRTHRQGFQKIQDFLKLPLFSPIKSANTPVKKFPSPSIL